MGGNRKRRVRRRHARGVGAKRYACASFRRIGYEGDEIATMLEVVGEDLVMIFQDDALARPGPVGTGDVGNPQPREQQAEGNQDTDRDLRSETDGVTTGHRLSDWH